MRKLNWEQGWFAAVATLIRLEGCATTNVDELFKAGGDPRRADDEDIELFRQHGLMP